MFPKLSLQLHKSFLQFCLFSLNQNDTVLKHVRSWHLPAVLLLSRKYVTINTESKKGRNKWVQCLPQNIKNKLVLLNQIFKKTSELNLFSSSNRKVWYSASKLKNILMPLTGLNWKRHWYVSSILRLLHSLFFHKPKKRSFDGSKDVLSAQISRSSCLMSMGVMLTFLRYWFISLLLSVTEGKNK